MYLFDSLFRLHNLQSGLQLLFCVVDYICRLGPVKPKYIYKGRFWVFYFVFASCLKYFFLYFFRVEMKNIFNPYFGSVFRSKKNPTFFSRRLFRVADVYTSRVTNFHNYSLGVSEYFLHGKRNQNYLKIYLHF